MKKITLFLIFIFFIQALVFALPSNNTRNTLFGYPRLDRIMRLLTLQDYNTRVVIFGTTLLGLAGGIIGTFMLLRKRSLMGDAISHATLPGIGFAFIFMTLVLGQSGKYLFGLLTGAVIFGMFGMVCVLIIRNTSKLKEEAALGIVLSVFFGLGISILGIIQKMKVGHAAGLESFIYGKTASMLASDAKMIAFGAGCILFFTLILFKEFKIICFDQDYAHSLGLPVILLDIIMMGMVVGITVIGLQAVGLILIIAMLIIPPASSRFWTDNLVKMVILSAFIGAMSGMLGAGMSAVLPKLPAGAVIVVVSSFFFFISMLFGSTHGIWVRMQSYLKITSRVNKQHFFRTFYELVEAIQLKKSNKIDIDDVKHLGVNFDSLLNARSWDKKLLNSIISKISKQGLLYIDGKQKLQLTDNGWKEAYKIVRNHRLWEIYLVTYAGIATSKVHRDADEIEHILGKDLVFELEALLAKQSPHFTIPKSLHSFENINRKGL